MTESFDTIFTMFPVALRNFKKLQAESWRSIRLSCRVGKQYSQSGVEMGKQVQGFLSDEQWMHDEKR